MQAVSGGQPPTHRVATLETNAEIAAAEGDRDLALAHLAAAAAERDRLRLRPRSFDSALIARVRAAFSDT